MCPCKCSEWRAGLCTLTLAVQRSNNEKAFQWGKGPARSAAMGLAANKGNAWRAWVALRSLGHVLLSTSLKEQAGKYTSLLSMSLTD